MLATYQAATYQVSLPLPTSFRRMSFAEWQAFSRNVRERAWLIASLHVHGTL